MNSYVGNSFSGYKDICWAYNRWVVRICKNYKTYDFGRFKILKEAIDCRNEALKKLHGEYARLNK
jgi:hypothetical protein